MGDNAALAAALNNIANALLVLNNNAAGGGGGGAAAPPAHVPILDPFAADDPFDLSSRAGSVAFAAACAALDDPWDGAVEKFPPFLINLKLRAKEMGWSRAGVTNITTINGHNLFDNYFSITDAMVTAARTARVNDRAIQNSRAMYKCLKLSITGDLRTTVFDQFSNVPAHEDGPTLLLTLTKFTMSSAIQLSMISFKSILDFDPALYKFHIPSINTQLNHLFVLATTANRTIHASEKLQHIVTIYMRIKQPEAWAQWIRIQTDRIEDGTITVPQDFMNSAALKYNKIVTADSGFQGSSNTLQEDIVAMLTSAKRKKPPEPKAPAIKSEPKRQPPFLRHFKSSSSADSTVYKIGDTKQWDNQTWHFCDCPNHRDRVKWHTHPPADCRTRIRWLETQASTSSANLGVAGVPSDDVPDVDASTSNTDTSSLSTNRSDITVLLADALGMVRDNDLAKDLIADALNSLHDQS